MTRTTPTTLMSRTARASAPVSVAGVTGGAVDPGVVDQHVDAALVLGDVRGGGGDGRVVGDVDGHEARAQLSAAACSPAPGRGRR